MAYEQFAYVYDRLMQDMPYDQWLTFTKKTWEEYQLVPKHVVDLGCGTGTIAIALAGEGYVVTGIDLAENMLTVAQHKQESLRSQMPATAIEWVQQDMREWQLWQPVDAVISLCDCLNYLLDEADIIHTFRQTYANLRSGGVFLFDVHTPAELFNYAEHQPYILNDDDIAYIWTNELDEQKMQIEHDLTIFVQQAENHHTFTRIDEKHIQRAYSLEWLEQSLRDIGFVNVRVGTDFIWDEVSPQANRAFFACQKK
jgi:ubiquinone/menaquinone biosynthesis C-methylase UbiE